MICVACIYRLFMCQDENEDEGFRSFWIKPVTNEPGPHQDENEDEGFRSFWIKPVTNEPGPQYCDTLKDRFVHHPQVPERTEALVFVFVFDLAHEQAISTCFCHSHICTRLTCPAIRMKRQVQPCFFPLSKSHSQMLPF